MGPGGRGRVGRASRRIGVVFVALGLFLLLLGFAVPQSVCVPVRCDPQGTNCPAVGCQLGPAVVVAATLVVLGVIGLMVSVVVGPRSPWPWGPDEPTNAPPVPP